jgi:translation initiation factor 2B subunit (eIF-2B alpha/beta/delta family)
MTDTQAIQPDHYGGKDNPYEAIKVIKAHNLNFCLGNVIKYVLRAGKKGDRAEDLRKAIKYLEMEIEIES